MSQTQVSSSSSELNLREDFPALQQEIHGHALVYLDSAASAQQPKTVIDTVARYQQHDHANVQVVLTSGTTESINLVAQSFCRPRLKPGDKVLITHLEHHSNIVPWQFVCEQTGAELLVAPIDAHGQLQLDALEQLLTDNVKMLAIGHVSNALGTINPIRKIISWAKERDIPVLVDGAQAVPHMAVDVQELGCDFYAFSGHKMLGPTGTGVLFGREALLDDMPPWQGGGDMILEVRFDGTVFNELPYKFEAGTPNIAGVIGLGAAVDYLEGIGMDRIADHEATLLDYLMQQLNAVDDLRLIGTAEHKASVQSFMLGDIHPHDLGTILDHQGVAIRTGHHCAMPVMDFFKLPGTARASLALYNTRDDVDRLCTAIRKAAAVFA